MTDELSGWAPTDIFLSTINWNLDPYLKELKDLAKKLEDHRVNEIRQTSETGIPSMRARFMLSVGEWEDTFHV
jgi:hypothetical protein